jgi:spore maturation protein CgeB
LKQLNIPTAFWFVEDFRTLTYWKDIAAKYDYFFAIQKGAFIEELQSRNIKNHYYLPQACLPALHKPLNLTVVEHEIYSSDLSFMGAAYYNRVQSFPQLLDFDFKIWGSGWETNSIFGPCLQKNGERVSSEECVRIFNGARINLNLHSSTFHESVNPNGDFVNPRTLEIAACGAFQLVDRREELHEMFKLGEELVDFESMEELKEKISYYLSHEEERKAIAARGQARALKEHTMEHRMQEMLIHIYMGHFEPLKSRLENRRSTLSCFIDEAGSETELGRYLLQFDDNKEFSLKTIVDHITQGEGALTKNELLLLMLDQVVMEAK